MKRVPKAAGRPLRNWETSFLNSSDTVTILTRTVENVCLPLFHPRTACRCGSSATFRACSCARRRLPERYERGPRESLYDASEELLLKGTVSAVTGYRSRAGRGRVSPSFTIVDRFLRGLVSRRA